MFCVCSCHAAEEDDRLRDKAPVLLVEKSHLWTPHHQRCLNKYNQINVSAEKTGVTGGDDSEDSLLLWPSSATDSS